MTHPLTKLGASTALITLFAAGPQIAAAQTIPSCNGDGAGIALSEVTPDQLNGNQSIDDVAAMAASGQVCVQNNGNIRMTGEGSAGAGAGAGAAPEQPQNEDAAAAEEAPAEDAPAEDVAEEETPAPEAAPEAEPEMAETPEPEAAPAEDVTPESLAEDLGGNAGAGAEAEAEVTEAPAEPEVVEEETAEDAAPEVEAEPEVAETPEVEEAPEEVTPESLADDLGGEAAGNTEGATAVTEAPEEPEAVEEEVAEEEAPAAETEEVAEDAASETEAADDDVVVENNGRPAAAASAAAATEGEAEAVETTETTVTEEDARSSDEDFAETPDAAPAARNNDDDDRGGLSNFEKFALGAAGLVVLNELIGQNDEVVENTGDRVVVQRQDGSYYVLKDDDELLRRPGADVRTETFSDGSTRTTVTRDNGVQVVTVSAADGTVLRRTRLLPDGREVILFDDTVESRPVRLSDLPQPAQSREIAVDNDAELRAALEAERRADLDRTFTLGQVRNIEQVRELMPVINVDAINFETGSAAIRPEEAESLYALGRAMADFIAENPDELFLIEGHTDAVGNDALNLALSDRRAESVALALTEYFDVPPENMVVQGYGEEFLLVPTGDAERANRRAAVRRITPLLQTAAVR
ncbi:OmpA family protein [Psychromarinibacter halotolerans]|uniref:OmpA family protein n=1 Tax=Psychromarinibacter halotolerans TaxID=1775175 RepID=A0ABV7GU64_9RHOB|nr:OmpA family protein [Psychromarinibacter halotolerans]MDF0594430.1 OmpA family protein [Psychromarinibacter halotolerans]